MAIDSNSEGAKSTAFKQTSEASAQVETVFDRYPLASFEIDSENAVAFPVQKIRQKGANRVIERERPYRDGAKLDDVGSKARQWTMEAIFHNSIVEEGLDAYNSLDPLYPEVLNRLLVLFDQHQTGDLTVPTIGKVRAKAVDYERTEEVGMQDCAVLVLVFMEDNEDSVDFRSITEPSVNAQGSRLALKTEFDAQSVGVDSFNLSQVRTIASELEAIANAPGEAFDDVRIAANTVRHSAEQVISAFSLAGSPARYQLTDPTATDAQRSLEETKDIAARATNDARRGRPRILSVVVIVATSLMELAAAVNQRYSDLLAINTQLPNPLFIEAGTIVRIFADAA
jgi:prophage DNA circulation protein